MFGEILSFSSAPHPFSMFIHKHGISYQHQLLDEQGALLADIEHIFI